MRDRKQRIITIVLSAIALAFLVTATETVINSLQTAPQERDTQAVARRNHQSLATNPKQSPINLPDNLPFSNQQSSAADTDEIHDSPLKDLVTADKIIMQRVETENDDPNGRCLSHVVQFHIENNPAAHLDRFITRLANHALAPSHPIHPSALSFDKPTKFLFSARRNPAKRVTIHFIPEKTSPTATRVSRTRVLLWYQDFF